MSRNQSLSGPVRLHQAPFAVQKDERLIDAVEQVARPPRFVPVIGELPSNDEQAL